MPGILQKFSAVKWNKPIPTLIFILDIYINLSKALHPSELQFFYLERLFQK